MRANTDLDLKVWVPAKDKPSALWLVGDCPCGDHSIDNMDHHRGYTAHNCAACGQALARTDRSGKSEAYVSRRRLLELFAVGSTLLYCDPTPNAAAEMVEAAVVRWTAKGLTLRFEGSDAIDFLPFDSYRMRHFQPGRRP